MYGSCKNKGKKSYLKPLTKQIQRKLRYRDILKASYFKETDTTLTTILDEMEKTSIIGKKVDDEDKKTKYFITQKGDDLYYVLNSDIEDLKCEELKKMYWPIKQELKIPDDTILDYIFENEEDNVTEVENDFYETFSHLYNMMGEEEADRIIKMLKENRKEKRQ